MNPGNLTAGAGTLRQAIKMLRLRWEETKAQWNDAVSQDFEARYILPLEQGCLQTIEQINRLAGVCGKCYQECSK